jgi:hypothetical protein
MAGRSKEKDITGYGLAKVIGQYLSSTRAADILNESFGKGGIESGHAPLETASS